MRTLHESAQPDELSEICLLQNLVVSGISMSLAKPVGYERRESMRRDCRNRLRVLLTKRLCSVIKFMVSLRHCPAAMYRCSLKVSKASNRGKAQNPLRKTTCAFLSFLLADSFGHTSSSADRTLVLSRNVEDGRQMFDGGVVHFLVLLAAL